MSVLATVDYLIVHVTATPPRLDIGAAEIDAMHRQRGFSSIGYHYVIRRDGTVESGRPETEVGAHVAGYNSVSLGVSMIGGVDSQGRAQDNATPSQYAALQALLGALAAKHKSAVICGHRDLSPDRNGNGVVDPQEYIKACPCFDAIPWARDRGLPAASIRGHWDARAPAPPPAPDSRNVYLQRLLSRAGYVFGAIDGDLGPRTAAAVMQFQLWAALPQTGSFDAPTVRRLRALFA
ncbi:N-acetylmuramoyl-L-alanine amidase [Rhizobium ruizarguesonis]